MACDVSHRPVSLATASWPLPWLAFASAWTLNRRPPRDDPQLLLRDGYKRGDAPQSPPSVDGLRCTKCRTPKPERHGLRGTRTPNSKTTKNGIFGISKTTGSRESSCAGCSANFVSNHFRPPKRLHPWAPRKYFSVPSKPGFIVADSPSPAVSDLEEGKGAGVCRHVGEGI